MEFHNGPLDYPLASDRSQVVSRAYGVLEEDGRAARAVFLIDPDGVARFETVHDDRVGRSIDEILRDVRVVRAQQALPSRS